MSIDQDDRNDDAACGKLWDIYVKEAQQYDEGMIRSWKEDMDNMLVFSGLYSAILTAFVIESYQNLQPDLAENSTALLQRISEQLASSSTLTPIPEESSFTPTTAALTCNILWFISLAMALTCSFLATLVQQWSRRFLHRTSTVRSPGAHAHLLQFLYFGLKDLRMHAVVDLIPSLLHLSLFSFFAGLVAFLHDVNNVLTWISTAALSLVLLMYVVLTVLPIFKLDSPYATPLSSLMWRLLQIWRLIRVSNRKPFISPLLRRLLPSREPDPRPHSTDEEAQIAPSDHACTAEVDKKVVLSPSPLEWNIVDATVKASRIRRVAHESRSIVWSLRSLNDDSELLPFVEALPDALQYREDSDAIRETNLHLLEALVASTEPQINIISRIFDLMDNAQNPWHIKSHKERCAIACARALYALGHVVQANPVRFRPLTHNSPLFTTETLNRIGQGFCHGALDMAYGQSALVMCALSSCLWVRERLALELDSSSDFPSIIQPVLAIARINWRYGMWDDISRYPTNEGNDSKFDDADRTQSQSIIISAIGGLLSQYTAQSTEYHPQHFQYVSKVVIGDDVDHLVDHFQCDHVLRELLVVLNSRNVEEPPKESNRDEVDAVLDVAIHLFCHANTRGPLFKVVLACIAQYHQTFGWGSPSAFGVFNEQSRLFKYLKFKEDYQWPLEYDHLTTLQHLLAYIGPGRENDDAYLFWAEIYPDIYRISRFLAYLIALKASYIGWLGETTGALVQLLDQIYDEISAETLYPNASRNSLHWITLCQCFASHLPIYHTSDVLKFFHSQQLSIPKYWEVYNNVPFLALLTHHSEDYYSMLLTSPKSELEDLLEVNAMIWGIWASLSDGLFGIETLEECRVWHRVYSLLRRLDEALTAEMRQLSQEIVRRPHSPQNPSSTILHPHNNHGIDRRKCLDLPANIEATMNRFFQFRRLFTTLPEPDAEEDQLLATDDHTYSNHVHRDRLAAHYFIRLPAHDNEEEAALQPPPGDPTYIHSELASDT